MTSNSDGSESCSIKEDFVVADATDATTFACVHWQHAAGLAAVASGAGGAASQAGRSHCNSHLGLGQVDGFLHFQSHLVSSHIGVHTGSGATQDVRQLAGEQTVSHFGQLSFSHISLGQRTLH